MTADPTTHLTCKSVATVALVATLLAGCASAPPAPPVVARSRLGTVTAADLDRFIADDPRWRGIGAEQGEASWRRARLEELLALTALAEEARRDRLLESGPAAESWQRRRRAILVEEVERRLPGLAPTVDDLQVTTYLAHHPEELQRDEKLRLRHVFRHLPARSTAVDRARARAEMEDLLAELRQGADFGTLARERSDSQTAGFDGLIAPVGRGDLEPAVETVVWRLQVGEISDLVEATSGFHIFRLEERIPAAGVPADQARVRVRARLERDARRAAGEEAFAALLRSSGAGFRPHVLTARDVDPSTAVFEMGSQRLTIRDLRERWSALPFAAQRATSLEDLLRGEAWQRLAAGEAKRLDLASDPAVATRLARAEEEALVSAASARWIEGVKARVGEQELADFVVAHEAGFRRPAASRLRAVIRHLGPGEAPLAVYDRLDRVAASVRSNELDLAEAARLWSTEPSGEARGDLGWVDAKTLTLWAGGRLAERVAGLADGALSDPLLVEVYEPERFRYRADAYALVRVEARRPEGMPPLEEIREDALDRLLASRAAEVRRELRRAILERIGATIDEAALVEPAASDR